MTSGKPATIKNDRKLRAFVTDVTSTLLAGKRHRTPGLGTFSTCTRKATTDRATCRMVMFRASTELREYAVGGSQPVVAGPHAEVVRIIIEAMLCENGVDVPHLGRLAVAPVAGKKPKLIFHGAKSINDVLKTS